MLTDKRAIVTGGSRSPNPRLVTLSLSSACRDVGSIYREAPTPRLPVVISTAMLGATGSAVEPMEAETSRQILSFAE